MDYYKIGYISILDPPLYNSSVPEYTAYVSSRLPLQWSALCVAGTEGQKGVNVNVAKALLTI